jgi:hypothetical protein
MIYNKNKNSLETAFLGKKFPWNGIPCCGVPWKRHSLEKFFLGVAFLVVVFLGKNFPCCGIP